MIGTRKEGNLSLPIAPRSLPALPFKEHWVKHLASLVMVVLTQWYFCTFTSAVYLNKFLKVLHFNEDILLLSHNPSHKQEQFKGKGYENKVMPMAVKVSCLLGLVLQKNFLFPGLDKNL